MKKNKNKKNLFKNHFSLSMKVLVGWSFGSVGMYLTSNIADEDSKDTLLCEKYHKRIILKFWVLFFYNVMVRCFVIVMSSDVLKADEDNKCDVLYGCKDIHK